MKKVNDLFFMRPWAITEDGLRAIHEVLDRRNHGVKLNKDEIQAALLKVQKDEKPPIEKRDGVAIVPVQGVISKRASLLNDISFGGGASTEQIKKDIKGALADQSVHTILLNIDSPGGSVDGVPELADFIFEARKQKKIYAYSDGQMCSAAYWIGSAAEKIIATRASEIGSIGVYSVVHDWSVANHNDGLKAEVIKAGKHKAAGHPDKPFTEEDRAVIQRGVNTYYDMFTESVKKNRGLDDEDLAAIATGEVFIGKQALEAGLIDEIGLIDDLFSGTSGGNSAKKAEEELSLRETEESGQTGTKLNENKKQEESMDLKALTLDELKVARPDLLVAAVAEGKAAGVTEGRQAEKAEAVTRETAEKARVVGILNKAKAIQHVDEAAITAIECGESIEAAEKSLKAAKYEKIKTGAVKPLGGGNEEQENRIEDSNETPEQKAERLWNAGGQIRQDFSSKEVLVGYLKAESEGRAKIFKGDRAQK